MEILQTGTDRAWKICGAVEIADVEELHEALCRIIGGDTHVTIDLAEVECCDAASLQLLKCAAKSAERLGGQLYLRSPSSAVEAGCAVLGLSLGCSGPGGNPPSVPERGERFGAQSD